jgi:hypothetical protein
MNRMLVLQFALCLAMVTCGHARAEPRERCESMITILRRVPSSDAAAALKSMDVERRRHRYVACAHAGTPALQAALQWKPLDRATQDRIRRAVRRAPLAKAGKAGTWDVGDVVPRSVPLQGLPRDMLGDVPRITSYRFFVSGREIVVVEPSTRIVVQKIAGRRS